jgi:hypothetical protein
MWWEAPVEGSVLIFLKDASYQVSFHLVKRFQRRFLEIDQSETRTACGGHAC